MADEPEAGFDADLFVDREYSTTPYEFLNGEVKVEVAALKSGSTDFDLTGQILWPAALALAYWVEDHVHELEGVRVLELGAGVGLPGLLAGALPKPPSKTVLTDGNEIVMEVLEKNVGDNFGVDQDRVIAERLEWGTESSLSAMERWGGPFDLILGADVVFWPAAREPLFDSVVALLNKSNPSAKFVVTYTSRTAQNDRAIDDISAARGLKKRVLSLREGFQEQHSQPLHIWEFSLE